MLLARRWHLRGLDLPNTQFSPADYGLAWVTRSNARALASAAAPLCWRHPRSGQRCRYFLNLGLAYPALAQAFTNAGNDASQAAGAPVLISWQDIAAADGLLVQAEQQVLSPASWLVGLLAMATVGVLAGGRMAERTRRVGLLKAVGGTPRLVGAALLAENLIVALLAAVAGIVAVLAFHAAIGQQRFGGSNGLHNPMADRDAQILLVVTVVLFALGILNVICTTWATVLDASRASALARALGSTPHQVSAGLAAAQVIPALPAAVMGIPLGIALFAAANGAGTVTVPPALWLATAVLGTLIIVAGLTTVPARIGARRSVAAVLQS